MGLILTNDELVDRSAKWREQDLRVVLTNGCFDLLHVGHLRTFKAAKLLGDLLVVGLNSDQSVRVLKGETRPVIPQDDRCELIAALEPVDFVIVFNEFTAVNLLEKVRPQVYVKGGDYSIDTLPEKEVLLRLNIEVKFIPLVLGVSTTELVQRIRTANICIGDQSIPKLYSDTFGNLN